MYLHDNPSSLIACNVSGVRKQLNSADDILLLDSGTNLTKLKINKLSFFVKKLYNIKKCEKNSKVKFE